MQGPLLGGYFDSLRNNELSKAWQGEWKEKFECERNEPSK